MTVPRTRGDCALGPRPCPWVRCRYHLGLSRRRGHESCALDVADSGPQEFETIAWHMRTSTGSVWEALWKAKSKLRRALRGEQEDPWARP